MLLWYYVHYLCCSFCLLQEAAALFIARTPHSNLMLRTLSFWHWIKISTILTCGLLHEPVTAHFPTPSICHASLSHSTIWHRTWFSSQLHRFTRCNCNCLISLELLWNRHRTRQDRTSSEHVQNILCKRNKRKKYLRDKACNTYKHQFLYSWTIC